MKPELNDLITVLDDESFKVLAREDALHLLSWSDLTNMPLPSGWSVRDVWEALFALRRISGIYIPIVYQEGHRKNFYCISRPFLDAVVELASLTSSGSPLHHQALQKESQRYKYKALVKETHSTAQLDGINISYEGIEQLLYTNRPANNVQERIIVNSFTMLNKLGSLIHEPFSEQLFLTLYKAVTEGISDKQLDENLPVQEGENTTKNMISYEDIYVYANDISKEKHEPAIVTALMVREAIQFLKPFPHLNSTIAWLIFRLYAIKHDYPVIGYLPIVYTTLEWEKGLLSSSMLSYDFSGEEDTTPMKNNLVIMGRTPNEVKRFVSVQEYSSMRYPDEGDVSRWTVICLELMLVALHSFQEELTTGLIDIHELSLFDTTLNYRQNSIVLRAKRNPEATFHIGFHQKANNIAYATARADLLELVDKGYLEMTKQGKTHVFVAGKKI